MDGTTAKGIADEGRGTMPARGRVVSVRQALGMGIAAGHGGSERGHGAAPASVCLVFQV